MTTSFFRHQRIVEEKNQRDNLLMILWLLFVPNELYAPHICRRCSGVCRSEERTMAQQRRGLFQNQINALTMFNKTRAFYALRLYGTIYDRSDTCD